MVTNVTWSSLAACLRFQQEVRTDTVDPSRRDLFVVGRLVLENDAGDMDGVRVQLGTGRDGVVTGLETRDG